MAPHHHLFILTVLLAMIPGGLFAQDSLSVQVPDAVVINEEFRLAYTYSSTESTNNYKIHWTPGNNINIVFGPATSHSSSLKINNGKTEKSNSVSFTYILKAKQLGEVILKDVIIYSDKDTIVCPIYSIKVVKTNESLSSDSSADKPSHSQNLVPSSGKRVDGVVANPYAFTKQSPIVSDITGWCYNMDSNKWSGNKGYISAKEGWIYASSFCYDMQSLSFSSNGEPCHILKIHSNGRYLYCLLSEDEFNQLKAQTIKGKILSLRYISFIDILPNAERIVREVESFNNSQLYLSFKKDEGNVVRFSLENNWSRNEQTGELEFNVEASETKSSGYFEISMADWTKLLNL